MKDPVDLVVRNATLVTASRRQLADIVMAGGMFQAIETPGRIPAAQTEIDATGLVALPGVIDSHVHFRQPGLEHEEDWRSGTRAAVMGGITTVLDMPNTIPPTDTVERAHEKLALAAASAYCDFGIFGLLFDQPDDSLRLIRDEVVVGLKAFMGPTTGNLGPPGDDALRAALAAGRRIAFHAEDEWEVESDIQALPDRGRNQALAHLMSRTVEAEVMAIDHVGQLVLESGGAGHIAHVSSIDGLDRVWRWRANGADLTCEVTPHHALLGHDVYAAFGGLAKVNPPIRGGHHGPRLLAALADGRINCVASDHAPHLEADKLQESIWDVPAGFAGVETLLPLMLTEVAGGRLSLERLVEVTSEGPARTWGLWPRKGAIAVGSDADLTLVDLGREGAIRAQDLHGKNNHSPFEGRATVGAPVVTIVRGQPVVRDGRLVEKPGIGRQVNRWI